MPTQLNIDTDNNYNQSQTFNIEGVTYNMTTYYNYRKGWYVGLYDINDEPIRIGVNLMPLASVFDDVPAIEGSILCLPNEGILEPPPVGEDNFGTGKLYNLFYYSQEELADLLEEAS